VQQWEGFMLDVSSSILLCSKFIFHLSFLNYNFIPVLCVCRNSLWMKKLICQLLIYLRQSIIFGCDNLAKQQYLPLCYNVQWLHASIQAIFIALCLLEILFHSNPQTWWMWLVFIKRMNNIHILIVVRLGWIVVARVWKWRLLRA
jgi:hypothetical protein